MNCAVLFQSLLPIPDLPPQIILTKHRLFLVLSALVFFLQFPTQPTLSALFCFLQAIGSFLALFSNIYPTFPFLSYSFLFPGFC